MSPLPGPKQSYLQFLQIQRRGLEIPLHRIRMILKLICQIQREPQLRLMLI